MVLLDYSAVAYQKKKRWDVLMTGLRCFKMQIRKGIKRIVSSCLRMIGVVILSGCVGNNTYFNVDKQSIVSCSGGDINVFELKADSQTYEFHVRKDVKSQTEIVIADIMRNNVVVQSYPNSFDTTFVLSPNSEYVFINRTIGDATESEVTFTTDKRGKIVNASRVECK